MSLAVAEFTADAWGGGTFPGTYGVHYTYPTNAEVDYFVGKKMNTLRLPFRWERLQQSLGGTFDAAEQGYIDSFVSYATSKGAYVVLDPHNYARYKTDVIGGGVVTNAHFADFWSKLATRYKGNSKVIFALMNEPHDMDTNTWVNAANAGIAAIRNAGATNLILVPGNAWTGAHSWVSSGNSTAMLSIADSGNNYAFEVHQYLDGDSSGTSSTCVSTTIGAERMLAFTAWLKANNKKGFLGELAGANNSTCQAALIGQLQHLKDNSSVWLGWTWWAAGPSPWWNNYMFDLEPTNNYTTDRPQMSWLTPFL
ncbi:glycoside hydrolase family 5 protein [Uliginosibacterium flavum]